MELLGDRLDPPTEILHDRIELAAEVIAVPNGLGQCGELRPQDPRQPLPG
ncbi:MAG: hypothetical protein ACRDI0_11850 [Actinomycetota bacterium]